MNHQLHEGTRTRTANWQQFVSRPQSQTPHRTDTGNPQTHWDICQNKKNFFCFLNTHPGRRSTSTTTHCSINSQWSPSTNQSHSAAFLFCLHSDTASRWEQILIRCEAETQSVNFKSVTFTDDCLRGKVAAGGKLRTLDYRKPWF